MIVASAEIEAGAALIAFFICFSCAWREEAARNRPAKTTAATRALMRHLLVGACDGTAVHAVGGTAWLASM
jgi:hypothetical protein